MYIHKVQNNVTDFMIYVFKIFIYLAKDFGKRTTIKEVSSHSGFHVFIHSLEIDYFYLVTTVKL